MQRCLSNIWGVMIGWQVCSLILTGAGAALSFNYYYSGDVCSLLSLLMCYALVFIMNIWFVKPAQTKWWIYILVGLCGFLDDWTAVLAYRYTSFASAMLLVTTVVFWVAPMAYFIFGRKINWIQFIAMGIAIAGCSMIMVAQGREGDNWKGNLLSLLSAILYAVSSVLQEKIVHETSKSAYLLRYSIGTTFFCAIMTGALEWRQIKYYNWNVRSGLLTFAYSFLLACYYISVPVVLEYSNSTIMNLSMLTSNFYSLIIDIVFMNGIRSWLYLLGFALVPIAIVLFVYFEDKPKVQSQDDAAANNEAHEKEAQELDNNNTNPNEQGADAPQAEH